MSRMADFHWEKVMENEGKARIMLKAQEPRRLAEYHREKHGEALKGLHNAKMNVSYRTIAAILNLTPETVALYVMHAKHILQRTLEETPTKRMVARFESGEIRLPRFEPFSEFGIGAHGQSA